MDLI
jgi:hypothetical protein